MKAEKSLNFEMSKPGRVAYSLPECDVPEIDAASIISGNLMRGKSAAFPEGALRMRLGFNKRGEIPGDY